MPNIEELEGLSTSCTIALSVLPATASTCASSGTSWRQSPRPRQLRVTSRRQRKTSSASPNEQMTCLIPIQPKKPTHCDLSTCRTSSNTSETNPLPEPGV